MHNLDLNDLAGKIRQLMATEFAPVKILDVKLAEETDRDGEKYLRVDVLYEGKPTQLAQDRLAGITGVVRTRLLDEPGENLFPVIYLIARSDFGAKTFEAA